MAGSAGPLVWGSGRTGPTGFGFSLAQLCSSCGDGGKRVLAVGAMSAGAGVNTNGEAQAGSGALYLVTLDWDGTVHGDPVKITSGDGGLLLSPGDGFGSSVALIGDIDGNGMDDLAVVEQRLGGEGVCRRLRAPEIPWRLWRAWLRPAGIDQDPIRNARYQGAIHERAAPQSST